MRLKLLCGGVIIMGDALPIHESIFAHAMFLDPRAIDFLCLALVHSVKGVRSGHELAHLRLTLALRAITPPSPLVKTPHSSATTLPTSARSLAFLTKRNRQPIVHGSGIHTSSPGEHPSVHYQGAAHPISIHNFSRATLRFPKNKNFRSSRFS